MLQELRSSWLAANAINYNSAISAREKGQQWKQALSLLQNKRRSPLAANVISYNSASSACEKGQQWKQAFNLSQEMRSSWLAANVISYNSAISACNLLNSESGRRAPSAADMRRPRGQLGLVSFTTVGYLRWVTLSRGPGSPSVPSSWEPGVLVGLLGGAV